MVIVTKNLQQLQQELETKVKTTANFVVNAPLSADVYLSCRLYQGKVEFAVYRANDYNLLTRLEDPDILPEAFNIATKVLLRRALADADLLIQGKRVPEDAEILHHWHLLDRRRDDLEL